MKVQRRDKTPRVQPLSLESNTTDRVSQVTNFLNVNYRIEVNKYDPSQMRIASLQRRYMFPPSVDDISLHMMQEGVPHTRNLIKMILNSPNQTKTYDPLREYFGGLREIQPQESQIDKLIAHLRVREFDDQPRGYYQERAGRLIRQWLVAAVACAMGQHANEAALVFVGEDGGQGKSYLANFLCPPPLHEMFVKSSHDRRSFSLEQAVTTNFMVLYDEMDGLTPGTAENFKKVVSSRKLAVRMKGDLCPIVRPRIASVVATTNNRTGTRHGFLHPSLGTRRFMCVHLDEIDFAYAECVNVDELWAEALQLSENPDYNYQLTKEDYAEFDQVNQRYMIETLAGAIVQQAFELPAGDEDGAVWMTSTEISAALRDRRLIRPEMARHATPQHIGEALASLGFVRKSINDSGDRRYKWAVKPL